MVVRIRYHLVDEYEVTQLCSCACRCSNIRKPTEPRLRMTPYELVRTGNVGDLTDLLKTLRGEEGEIIAEEASFIIRYPSI